MHSMSPQRAMIIDNIMLQALKQKEDKGYPTVELQGGSTQILTENVAIGKILESKGCGKVVNGTSCYITPDGLDFIKCGGFTQILKDETTEEERKERQDKLTKKHLAAAKREPLFRWAAIVFGSISLIQFLMQIL